MSRLRIIPATERDVADVYNLIRALAEFEDLLGGCSVTEADLRRDLFGETPSAEVWIGWLDDEPVGYMLFFTTYSSFLGKPGIWLEDLFVRSEHRGRGFGRMLLTQLAQEAVSRDCGRLEWSVLNWNERAIDFYRSLGARPVDGWTTYRLTDTALSAAGSVRP